MQLIDVPWCTIPPALSRVVITKKPNIVHPQVAYTPIDPLRLLSRLQAIQYVKFHAVSLENIPLSFWSVLHQLGGVRELEIHQMSFKSPVHFFRYVCSLPALEALSISRSSIEIAAPDLAPLRLKGPFYIPFLDVAMLSPSILDWFLRHDSVPSVHTLRINLGRESAKVASLGQFVEVVGSSIQNLQLTLPSDIYTYNLFPPPVDFSLFRNVRAVYVEGYLRLGEEPGSRLFEDLTRSIFTQITSPLLEKVSLNYSLHIDETMIFFGIPNDILLDLFRWGALPETLGGKSYQNLRSLRLALRGFPPYQRCKAEDSLRKGPFASFASRNILSVGFL
ncbi:hypothetical protein H2248_011602 [Termitomyces sp. 'cryptogamus']|nr:hypothetical protein H2248_011602 [Termitomyces sp. 'cryptogamus']